MRPHDIQERHEALWNQYLDNSYDNLDHYPTAVSQRFNPFAYDSIHLQDPRIQAPAGPSAALFNSRDTIVSAAGQCFGVLYAHQSNNNPIALQEDAVIGLQTLNDYVRQQSSSVASVIYP